MVNNISEQLAQLLSRSCVAVSVPCQYVHGYLHTSVLWFGMPWEFLWQIPCDVGFCWGLPIEKTLRREKRNKLRTPLRFCHDDAAPPGYASGVYALAFQLNRSHIHKQPLHVAHWWHIGVVMKFSFLVSHCARGLNLKSHSLTGWARLVRQIKAFFIQRQDVYVCMGWVSECACAWWP